MVTIEKYTKYNKNISNNLRPCKITRFGKVSFNSQRKNMQVQIK